MAQRTSGVGSTTGSSGTTQDNRPLSNSSYSTNAATSHRNAPHPIQLSSPEYREWRRRILGTDEITSRVAQSLDSTRAQPVLRLQRPLVHLHTAARRPDPEPGRGHSSVSGGFDPPEGTVTPTALWTRSKFLDSKLVHWWLGSCQHRHRCKPRIPTLPEIKILVIDCQEKCLTRVTTKSRYFALSYVWGAAKCLETTQSRLAEFSKPCGLDRGPEQLSRTIHDAMVFLQQINERYLWVDRLCIVQDDPEQKHKAIAKMDQVYMHATAVIIAAAGEDASAGLPGVKGHPRTSVSMERAPGISSTNQLGERLKNSVYDTRGWT
jgi:hypothetical protein